MEHAFGCRNLCWVSCSVLVGRMENGGSTSRGVSLRVHHRLHEVPAFVAGLNPADFEYTSSGPDVSFAGGCMVATTLSELSLSNTAHRSTRSSFEGRLANLSGPGTNVVLCYCDVDEPEQEALTYINEACFGRSLVLAWTPAEIAAYITAFRDAGSSTLHAGLARPKQNEALHVLLDFLQTSKVMNRLDSTRLADKFQTPADVLSTPLHALEELPAFGVTKARKMHRLLHTEFPTTRRRLEEYPSSTAPSATPAATPAAQGAPALPPSHSTGGGTAAKTYPSAAQAGAAAIFGDGPRPSRRPARVPEALARRRIEEAHEYEENTAMPIGAGLEALLQQIRQAGASDDDDA